VYVEVCSASHQFGQHFVDGVGKAPCRKQLVSPIHQTFADHLNLRAGDFQTNHFPLVEHLQPLLSPSSYEKKEALANVQIRLCMWLAKGEPRKKTHAQSSTNTTTRIASLVTASERAEMTAS